MTFTDIVDAAAEILNITSADGLARIGRHVNTHYRRLTTAIGLNTTRQTEVQSTATIGSQFVTFSGVERVDEVIDKSSGSNRYLTKVFLDDLDHLSVLASDAPTHYAIYRANGTTVQIKTNATAQTAYTLYAPGVVTVATLAGTDVPAFPESFHDVLTLAAVYEERLKQEKMALAQIARAEYEDRLGDLRLFLATSAQQDIYQGKTPGSILSGGGATSGGAAAAGSTSYTQTGLITFDRSGAGAGSAPFAVAAGSGTVSHLDVDLLDGEDSTAFHDAAQLSGLVPLASVPAHASTHVSGGSDAIKLDDLAAPDDTTDLNVSSTKHGLSPKSPANAAQFLNGAATPAYAAVKDSDLSTSDVTTNNVTTVKHGFTPKAPNDATKFLDGTGAWSVPAAPNPVVQTTTATGTQNDFALSTSVAVVRCNNATDITFTGLAAGTDGQKVVFVSIGAGNVYFKHQNTGSSAANRLINFVTSGDTPLAAGSGSATFEYDGTTQRWRLIQHEQGGYLTSTFSASNFTASGSMTWTVDSGDVLLLKWKLVGRTLHVAFNISATTVGGTVSDTLHILSAAYGGYTQASTGLDASTIRANNNSTIDVGLAQIPAAATSHSIDLFHNLTTTNWSLATNTTGVSGTIVFEVQ